VTLKQFAFSIRNPISGYVLDPTFF